MEQENKIQPKNTERSFTNYNNNNRYKNNNFSGGNKFRNSFKKNESNTVSGESNNQTDFSNRRNNNRRRSLFNKNRNRKKLNLDNQIESKVILVRRVTRVVKGGKRMRFSALVVVGNKNGEIGFAIKKGLDFQDSVNKATKKAKTVMQKIFINENQSLNFESKTKYKSAIVYLKPAKSGTGVIAGGYIRPVLELAGIKNIYSKIIGTRNKISGTQAVFEALKKYTSNNINKEKTVIV